LGGLDERSEERVGIPGVSGTIQEERQTLHVMDGLKRLAMVETKTVDAGSPVAPLLPMQRYQLGNHLGSAMLELDETGLVISYEEYHPYGTSAYRSARSGVEVSARRYRYVGMERDDETGLYLMGARHYACWLGRWTSADPMGIGADGPGLYNYTRGSPVTLSDPSGYDGIGSDEDAAAEALRQRTEFLGGAYSEDTTAQTTQVANPDIPEDLTTGTSSSIPVAKATPAKRAAIYANSRYKPEAKNATAPGFERGQAAPPPPGNLLRDMLEGTLAGLVSEAGGTKEDAEKGTRTVSNVEFAFNFALLWVYREIIAGAIDSPFAEEVRAALEPD